MLNNHKPLVSVITTSYNHIEFVEKSIRSILNQTYSNLEIIVVDDGSTDGSQDVIEKIKDNRINFLRIYQNRLFHPRNLALKYATGEYIAFQNSDDIWKLNKLEEQLKVIEKNKNIGACFTQVEIIDKYGKLAHDTWANGLFCDKNRDRFSWLRRLFDKGNCLCISSALVRREILEKVGDFRASLFQLSDFDMWIRVLGISGIYMVEKPLTQNRVVKGKNISEPNENSKWRDFYELSKVLDRYIEEPQVKLLDKIFPEIVSFKNTSLNIKLMYLVKYAWSQNTSSKLFFANKLMSQLVENPKSRKEVVDYFGSKIINEFNKETGKLKLSL